ncbi:MAG: glycosyl hydrolase family 28 protein [Chthoniobacterales bacterium]
MIFDITSFGARGDGITMNTAALQAAAVECARNGGGTILVPKGRFLTGVFQIFGSTTLHIQKGACLIGSPNLEDRIVGSCIDGLIYALDADDILLTGEGKLDGNAGPFFHTDKRIPFSSDFLLSETRQGKRGLEYGSSDITQGPMSPKSRPGNMLVFGRCKNLRIENLTITGSAYWTIHCADCDGVVVDNLKIHNDETHPNNDGIHLTTCKNSVIENCDIICGDDAIAITGFRNASGEKEIALGLSGLVGTTENIHVRNCNLRSRSSAVRVGYGENPVRNVVLENLIITQSNRGIGIYARQANVEDVVVKNCKISTHLFHGNWWGRGEPIHISNVSYVSEEGGFLIRDILIEDIEAVGENALTLYSEKEGGIDNVKLIRVDYLLRKGELFESWGGNLDLRPTARASMGIFEGGTAPLWSVGVTKLELINCNWRVEPEDEVMFSTFPVMSDVKHL